MHNTKQLNSMHENRKVNTEKKDLIFSIDRRGIEINISNEWKDEMNMYSLEHFMLLQLFFCFVRCRLMNKMFSYSSSVSSFIVWIVCFKRRSPFETCMREIPHLSISFFFYCLLINSSFNRFWFFSKRQIIIIIVISSSRKKGENRHVLYMYV